jgi:hypothetical protein
MDLSFEPPEPPGADWPDFVRLSYGYNEGLPDDFAKDKAEAYPNGHLGWLVRMGYHLITRLDEQTPRVSDEAVVMAAVLYDLEVERSLPHEDEVMEIIDTLKGQVLEHLRTCQLPTGATVYSDEEALSVLRR